jgi:DNA-binding HxlR family transcriptional regulator
MPAQQSPLPASDDVIHSPYRLRICSLLHRLGDTEYQLLRDSLDISPSVLSKHLKRLEEAGYIQLSSRTVNTRPHGWASLTETGRKAFLSHVAYLEQIIRDTET